MEIYGKEAMIMVKFFKKKPEKCSVCGQEKIIARDVRSGLTHFKYCAECYDSYYKKIEGRVKDQVMAKAKAGQKIGIQEALDLTKQISAEVEAEQNCVVIDSNQIENGDVKK